MGAIVSKYEFLRKAAEFANIQERGFHPPDDIKSLLNVLDDPRIQTHPLAGFWLMLDVVRGPYQLRLIHVEPAKRDDDPLQIQIGGATLVRHHTNLKSCSKEYYAISYTWGSQPLDHRIFIYDTPIMVSKSCYNILRAVRRQMGSALVWIDQLCINQTEWARDGERRQQIETMGQIYAGAEAVLVWTDNAGLSRTEVKNDFALIKKLYKNFESLTASHPSKVESNEATWSSLLDILQSPYFSRRWVLQEISMNENVIAVFDHDYIPFSWILGTAMFFLMLKIGKIKLRKPLPESIEERLHDHQALTEGARATISLQVSALTAPNQTMFELLSRTQFFETTNPHDSVHSLRSLASDKNELPVSDYEQSFTAFCIAHTIHFFNCGHSTELLLFGGRRPVNSTPMPSWCIDWTSKFYLDSLAIFCPKALMQKKESCAKLQAGALHVRCFPVGHIRAVSGEAKERLVLQMEHLGTFAAENFPDNLLHRPVFNYVEQLSRDNFDLTKLEISSWFDDLEVVDAALRLLAIAPRLQTNVRSRIQRQLHFPVDSPLNRRGCMLAVTQNGQPGLVPLSTEPNDLVVFLEDLPMPSIVRKINESRFYLIGTCYFVGLQPLQPDPELMRLEGNEIALV